MVMAALYSVYILTLALLLYMVFLLVRMSGSKAAGAFLCVVFSEILIIFGMMLEVMEGKDVGAALVCLKLQYVGQAIFSMSLLYFCSIFLHIRIPKIVYAAQFVVEVVVLIACLTAEHHTLFYSSMVITTADAPYPTLKVTDGPIWYLHYVHLFLVQFAVIIIAFIQYGKSNSRQKARSLYLVAGIGTETGELILKGLGLFGSFNPFVIAALIFTICLYVGIIRYGYFDTVEVAMNNALNNSTEGFLVAGNDERIMYLNMQMEKLFPGLRIGESVRYAALVAEIFDGKREIHQDGVYYRAVLEDVREGDLCDGKMLRLIDMTDYYKRLELLRRESENKTAFLSRVSHEIRTPLNTINGMNEMILRECRDEQILTYARDIREAEEILMGLIGDVLDVTRIEKSEIILDENEFDARRLLRRLWCAAEVKCRKKDLKLDFRVQSSLPAVWYADEARVYQIAENLLSNAIKYTNRGSVHLTLRRGDMGGIVLSVKDTGIGIPEDSIEKIFHRFEQLQTNSRQQGLGLGLEIVKSLVDKMQGQITVRSTVRKGSRFTVTLPLTLIDGECFGTDWKKAPAEECWGVIKQYSLCNHPKACAYGWDGVA